MVLEDSPQQWGPGDIPYWTRVYICILYILSCYYYSYAENNETTSQQVVWLCAPQWIHNNSALCQNGNIVSALNKWIGLWAPVFVKGMWGDGFSVGYQCLMSSHLFANISIIANQYINLPSTLIPGQMGGIAYFITGITHISPFWKHILWIISVSAPCCLVRLSYLVFSQNRRRLFAMVLKEN